MPMTRPPILGGRHIPPPKSPRPHNAPPPNSTNYTPTLYMLVNYRMQEHDYSEEEAEKYALLHMDEVEQEAAEKGGIDPALFGYNSIPM